MFLANTDTYFPDSMDPVLTSGWETYRCGKATVQSAVQTCAVYLHQWYVYTLKCSPKCTPNKVTVFRPPPSSHVYALSILHTLCNQPCPVHR